MDPSKSLQNFCLAECLVSVSVHSLTTLLFLAYDNMALFQIVFYGLIVLGSKSFFQLADLLLVRVRADKLSKLVNQPVFHFSRLRAETQCGRWERLALKEARCCHPAVAEYLASVEDGSFHLLLPLGLSKYQELEIAVAG